MKIRPIAAVLTLFALMLPATGQTAARLPRTVSVQLLAINDLHSNLEPPTGGDGLVNGVPAGGTEYLATHLKAAASQNPNTLIVGAGDIFGGSPLLSALFQDRPAIEAANALHLSVTSIGNHELDHGSAALLRQIAGGCREGGACSADERSPGIHYQYLAGNVMLTGQPGRTLLPATAIRTVGGVRIGFIGVTKRDTDKMLQPEAARGLEFLEESAVANKAAAELERQGVHTIVLLIHEGGKQNPSIDADPNACHDFTGELTPILEHLSPSIRVVVSAHTHMAYRCEIAGRLVTSAGAYGRLFTRIQLSVDRVTGRLEGATAENEIVTRDVAKDPEQTAILGRYEPQVAQLAGRIVGAITADIPRVLNHSNETEMGEVVADAALAATRAPERGGAVIAFMNSGGVRAELTPSPDASGRRSVTYGDLYAVLPFSNRLTVFTMTGEQLRRLLEQQFAPTGQVHILQVSDGFSYRYRRNAAQGEHVVPGSMTLNGRAIQPGDSLRVAVNDFMAAGGEGMSVFREGTQPVLGPVDLEALVAYFGAHSPVAPGPLNRVLRVD